VASCSGVGSAPNLPEYEARHVLEYADSHWGEDDPAEIVQKVGSQRVLGQVSDSPVSPFGLCAELLAADSVAIPVEVVWVRAGHGHPACEVRAVSGSTGAVVVGAATILDAR
jgi:hypothetical protein